MYEFNVFKLWDEDVTYAGEKRQPEKKQVWIFFRLLIVFVTTQVVSSPAMILFPFSFSGPLTNNQLYLILTMK